MLLVGLEVVEGLLIPITYNIGFNRIYKVRQAGVGVKWASDIIISQNTISDVVDTRTVYPPPVPGAPSLSPSPSKGVGFQYGSQRLWVLYNEIYNCSFGIFAGSTALGGPWYMYVVGNIIHDIRTPASLAFDKDSAWSEAGIMIKGGTYRYIVNNTLYDVDSGIHGPAFGTDYYMHNNIISNILQADGYHIFMADITTGTRVNDSLFYDEGGTRIRWRNVVSTSVSDFHEATEQCANCYETDSNVLSAMGGGKLKLSSPSSPNNAIDKGVLNEVYGTFQTLYGLNIAVDFSGVSRPQGLGWDMGAYESVGSSNPPAKTILSVE